MVACNINAHPIIFQDVHSFRTEGVDNILRLLPINFFRFGNLIPFLNGGHDLRMLLPKCN